MATITSSYLNADVRGVPAFEVMDTFVGSNLVCTAEPAMTKPTRILMADNQSFAQFTVVGLDANKKVVKATFGGVTPIGITLHAASSGANNTTKAAEVCLTGDFNAGIDDAGTDSPLVWDASFDTLTKKKAAVIGNPLLRFGTRLVAAI